MPCNQRFWFVVVNWSGLFFSILNQVVRHDYLKLEEMLESKATLTKIQDVVYVLRHFTDKAGTAWATIILMQAYLAPNPFGYIGTLIDSSVCVFLFNVSFSTQLFFVTMDALTSMATFMACNVISMMEPVSAEQALAMKIAEENKPLNDGVEDR